MVTLHTIIFNFFVNRLHISELPYNHIAHKYTKLQYEQITHVIEDFVSELLYGHIAHSYM